MPDWEQAEADLGAIYRKFYPALINRAAADVAADLGRPVTVDPDLADKITGQIASRVKGVTETQRDRIAGMVNQYEGNPDGLRAALSDALDGAEDRAGVIARTEVVHTVNSGRVAAMSGAGLTHVLVLDGDGDKECASVDGTTQTLEWAMENTLGHPNCTRSFEVLEDDTED